jgi:hypothetical protein
MPGSPHSPIASLVLFMVCLSVAGAFLAGAHYYAVDLPQQQSVQVPENTCIYTYGQCKDLYYNYHWMKLCCWKDCCTSPTDCDIT